MSMTDSQIKRLLAQLKTEWLQVVTEANEATARKIMSEIEQLRQSITEQREREIRDAVNQRDTELARKNQSMKRHALGLLADLDDLSLDDIMAWLGRRKKK